jgi:hypothetical protein
MESESWIQSLLNESRRFQNDANLLARDITDAQLKALQTRISSTKLDMTRSERLECLRLILGYARPIGTTWDLSMADAKGILDLTDEEFRTIFMWAFLKQGEGALI